MTATANHGHSIFCCTIIMHGRHHRMKMLPVLVGHRTRLSVQQNQDKPQVPLAVILLAISGAVINKLAPLTSHRCTPFQLSIRESTAWIATNAHLLNRPYFFVFFIQARTRYAIAKVANKCVQVSIVQLINLRPIPIKL